MKKIPIIQLFVITACTLIIISCGSISIVFEMDLADSYLKPGTIAVVSGTNRDQDYMLAESITINLQKETGFKVMSQKEISEKVPDYFYKNIISGWEKTPADRDSRFWFSPENRKAVNALQKYLNTEYIFVVWSGEMNVNPSQPIGVAGACVLAIVTLGVAAPTGSVGASTISAISVNGRLLSYPDGDVIGYTADSFYNESCCIIMPFRTYNHEITDLLNNTGRDIALEMNKFTKNKEINKKRVWEPVK